MLNRRRPEFDPDPEPDRVLPDVADVAFRLRGTSEDPQTQELLAAVAAGAYGPEEA